MSGFLLATALVIAFVAGSVLSLRPSPRQRQLARLREHAVAAGLRVQWRPGGQDIAYLLPWALPDAAMSRGLRFGLERPAGAVWDAGNAGMTDPKIDAALAVFPATVTIVRAVPEGLQACWNEAGTVDDVELIARALRELGSALLHDA